MKEIWKDIPNYEGYYQVSNFGNVKSLPREVRHPKGGITKLKGKTLALCIGSMGYYIVILRIKGNKKTKRVHQLVAEAFLGHKPCGYTKVVNHIDFNPLNNHVNNLEIITQRKNTNQKHLKSKSKYVGVTWRKAKKKWVATIRIGNKRKQIGSFTDEKEASKAYKREVKRIEQLETYRIKTVRIKERKQ